MILYLPGQDQLPKRFFFYNFRERSLVEEGERQVNRDHLSGHLRGRFRGHLHGKFSGSFRGEPLEGSKQGKSTLMAALASALMVALVGPTRGSVHRPIMDCWLTVVGITSLADLSTITHLLRKSFPLDALCNLVFVLESPCGSCGRFLFCLLGRGRPSFLTLHIDGKHHDVRANSLLNYIPHRGFYLYDPNVL